MASRSTLGMLHAASAAARSVGKLSWQCISRIDRRTVEWRVQQTFPTREGGRMLASLIVEVRIEDVMEQRSDGPSRAHGYIVADAPPDTVDARSSRSDWGFFESPEEAIIYLERLASFPHRISDWHTAKVLNSGVLFAPLQEPGRPEVTVVDDIASAFRERAVETSMLVGWTEHREVEQNYSVRTWFRYSDRMGCRVRLAEYLSPTFEPVYEVCLLIQDGTEAHGQYASMQLALEATSWMFQAPERGNRAEADDAYERLLMDYTPPPRPTRPQQETTIHLDTSAATDSINQMVAAIQAIQADPSVRDIVSATARMCASETDTVSVTARHRAPPHRTAQAAPPKIKPAHGPRLDVLAPGRRKLLLDD